MKIALSVLLVTAFTLAITAQEPAPPFRLGPTQEAEAPPLVAERDLLVLTVLQQQVEIANLRLQKTVADLKKPGWRVDLVAGQWRYVPEPTEKKEP